MAFSREYFAWGQCVRPLYAWFKECHLPSYSTEHSSDRTCCKGCVCVCVYLSSPLIFSSVSLKSLAPKAKVLDLQSSGHNIFFVAQNIWLFLSLDLICSGCCIFFFFFFHEPKSPKWPQSEVCLQAAFCCFEVFHNAEASKQQFFNNSFIPS